MEKKKGIWEYEELTKAKMFFIEGNKEFHDLTFEKIKKGLGSEYLENINEKIERWIDITIFEHFQKVRPVEYYILVKMLYRDGFYESAIIAIRCICEMICYDILKNMKHPFGSEVGSVNFRSLLKFISIPKRLSKELFEIEILNKISKEEDRNFIISSFIFDPKSKEYFLELENAKHPKGLKKCFSIFEEVGFESFETITKENYDILNKIYDLGNDYVHASKKFYMPKKDTRKIILDIGKVLYDIYGINSFEELGGYEMETAYKDYPDICSGINFMIEAFFSPEDAMRGYHNVPSERFLEKLKNTVGNWKGKWTCQERIVEDAKLHIDLKNDYLMATIEHTSNYDKQIINVKEELGIEFFQGYFHMQGYNSKLEPLVDNLKYQHNFFELEFLGDDILIGSHKCVTGNGKALFFRTQ